VRLDLEKEDVELIIFNLETGLQEHKKLLSVEKWKMCNETVQRKDKERCLGEIRFQGEQVHRLTDLLIKIGEAKRQQGF